MDATPTELASSPPRSSADAPDDPQHPSPNGTPRSQPGKVPRNPTPLQRERLIAALVDALDYARMEQLASFVFGRRSDLIFNPRWLLTEIALKIVERAEEQHRLHDLQTQATELNPHNDLLQRWFQDTASWVDSPYRGFAAFAEDDEEIFFGRKAFVDRLAEAVDQRPVVVVTGASGSGKSSVVFAGLAPRLAQSGDWLAPVCFRPGKRPFTRLASCLVQRLEFGKSHADLLIERDKLAARLRDKTVRLDDLIESLRGTHRPSQRLLLVADQFEDLFSPAVEAAERDAFLDVLLGALAGSDERPAPAVLVVTMRSDCIRRAQEHPLFAAVPREGCINLPRMRREELRQVVEGPAAVRGIELTAGVTDLILEDTADQPGNLPLLEFSMTRLAELLVVGKRDQPIALLLPQVEAALVKHADDVVVKLGEDSPHLRKIFLHLVRAAEGASVTRLRSSRHGLGEEAWQLVDRLADARVVVTDYDEEHDVETVELAHDTLLTNWPRLQAWIAEDAIFLQWLDRLRIAMREWESHRDQPDAAESLLSGPRLVFAESWLNNESRGAFLSPAQRTFIEDSIAKRDADLKAEEDRQSRTTRRLVAGLIAALVLMAFAGSQWLVATEAQRAATEAQRAAENEALTGASRRLAAAAEQELDNFIDRRLDLALLLGLEALDKDETSEAHDALLQGLTASPHMSAVLTETGAPVTSVGFSPDGDLLARGSTGGPVAIWDLDSRQLLDSQIANQVRIRSLAFSPSEDDRLMAAGTLDGDVVFWRIDDDLGVHEWTRLADHHRDTVTSIAFSPDGRTLATASADGSMTLQDAPSGDDVQVTQYRQRAQPAGHQSAVTSIAFDNTGEVLASSSVDGTVMLWDVTTGEAKGKPLIGHTGAVWSVAFSPAAGNSMLASGGSDGFITLWDPAAGTVLARREGHAASAVSSVAFSHDGTTIVSGGGDRAIIVWTVTGAGAGETRVPSLEKRATLTGNDVRVTSVGFAPDGQSIASGGFDGAVLLWDVAEPYAIRERLDGLAAVKTVALSPDGETLAAAATQGNDVILAPVSDPSAGQALSGHTDQPLSVAFSTDGTTLVSGGQDDMVIAWDPASGKERVRCEGHANDVTSVVFADTSRFASGDANGGVRLWELGTGTCQGQAWPDHEAAVTSMAFSADGSTLATGDANGVVFLRHVTAVPPAEPIRLDPAALGLVTTSLAFSPDGTTLVAGGADGAVAIWDVADGQRRLKRDQHESRIVGVSISADGRVLISGSVDGTINFWSLLTRHLVVPSLDAGRIRIESLAFGRDGSVLVSSGQNSVFLWDLRPSSWGDLACDRVSRNLSEDEWQRFLTLEPPAPEATYEKTCERYASGAEVSMESV